MAEGGSNEAQDDEVVITRVSPPPPKRRKVDKEEVAELVYVDSEEPLRCSTPQPAASGELSGDDLNATLEELGISHDSLDVFIDETSSSLPPVGAVAASFSTFPHLNAVPHSGNKDERREQELLFGLNNEYAGTLPFCLSMCVCACYMYEFLLRFTNYTYCSHASENSTPGFHTHYTSTSLLH
jgi:hypothetical protein